MLSIAEWHEVFKVIFAVFAVATLVVGIFVKWLEFTYKRSHKKIRKVQKAKKTTIVYDLGDTSKMTLYEIKQLKEMMRKELRANV